MQPPTLWYNCPNVPWGESAQYADRTRRNGFKPKESRWRLDVKKKFFMVRVVKFFNRLPRGVLNVPYPETFRTGLDRVLSNKIKLKMSQLTSGGLDLNDL